MGTVVCGASFITDVRLIYGSGTFPTGCTKTSERQAALVHVADYQKMQDRATGDSKCDACASMTCGACHAWLMGRAVAQQSQFCDDPCVTAENMCFPYYQYSFYHGLENVPLVKDPAAHPHLPLEGPTFANMSSLGECLSQSRPCSNARVTSYSSTKRQDLAVYYRFVNEVVGKEDGWGAVQWVVAGEEGCSPGASPVQVTTSSLSPPTTPSAFLPPSGSTRGAR